MFNCLRKASDSVGLSFINLIQAPNRSYTTAFCIRKLWVPYNEWSPSVEFRYNFDSLGPISAQLHLVSLLWVYPPLINWEQLIQVTYGTCRNISSQIFDKLTRDWRTWVLERASREVQRKKINSWRSKLIGYKPDSIPL